MPFAFVPFAECPDVVLISPKAFEDDRGWFVESYRRSEFAQHGIDADFTQDNHSRSTRRGVLRGLHYQNEPMAQGKLIRCVAGEVFDVAVDIRRGSPTFGRSVSTRLSAVNRRIMWVPIGFAHGVLTLTDMAELLYKASAEYSPAHEGVIRWNDPSLGIRWPITAPVLAPRDAGAPLLADADVSFVWDPQSRRVGA